MVITVENVLLSVRHLKKAFGDHMIFEDFDLDVRKGEVVVVIGPSGCGKSTLLRCLNGLEPIQGGEILLDGEPVLRESKSITRMRQKIGMVFQSYELFPHKTILENILLAPMKVQKRPRSDVEKEALELLERVGLADRKNDYPRQLSGGQKQRVAIVRALCMHPEILLLDEITAALDPAGKLLGRPQFKIIQTKEAKITCTPSLGMQFDGEIISSNSGVFGARALPQCLDIIVDEFSPLGK